MTYASDLGLKVGSKIKVLSTEEGEFFKAGDVITLIDDDDSALPWFSGVDYTRKPMDLTVVRWEHYKEEKEINKRLERNQEYDVKLTGEEIAFLGVVLGNMDNIGSFPHGEIYEKLGQFVSKDKIYWVPSISITHCSGEIRSAMIDIFKPIETEDQRKLRELKEQYAKLGDSIAAMEKK